MSRMNWVVRSNQGWKVTAVSIVPPLLSLFGVCMFFTASWPESFYGALLVIAAAPVWVLLAGSIQCPVCDKRVAFGAPFGQWRSHMEALQTCPRCGDDGEARPAAPGQLTIWQQAEREFARRERARERRLASTLWVVALAAAAATVGIAILAR